MLSGESKQRLRDLELKCRVEVDPERNLVWVEMEIHNHSEEHPQYVSAYTDELWMHDRGGQAAYALGSIERWPDKPPKEPVYATLAPQETRTWKVEGLPSPSPMKAEPPAHDFVCAASIGPDGRQFLQAGGRAVNGVLNQMHKENQAASKDLKELEEAPAGDDDASEIDD